MTSTGAVTYKPVLIGAAKLHYLDDKQKLDEVQNVVVLAPFGDGAAAVDWTRAKPVDAGIDELEKEPEEGAQFEDLPAAAAKAKNYEIWKRSFTTWLFQAQKLELVESPSLGQRSKPGESERDFRIPGRTSGPRGSRPRIERSAKVCAEAGGIRRPQASGAAGGGAAKIAAGPSDAADCRVGGRWTTECLHGAESD